MKRLVLTLMAAVLLSSCATLKSYVYEPVYTPIEDEMNEVWKGASYAEIVSECGTPTRTEPDGNEGQILVYEEITETTTTFEGVDENNQVSTTSTDRTYTEFYMDKSNNCYKVRSNEVQETGTKLSPANVFLVGFLGSLIAESVAGIILL